MPKMKPYIIVILSMKGRGLQEILMRYKEVTSVSGGSGVDEKHVLLPAL